VCILFLGKENKLCWWIIGSTNSWGNTQNEISHRDSIEIEIYIPFLICSTCPVVCNVKVTIIDTADLSVKGVERCDGRDCRLYVHFSLKKIRIAQHKNFAVPITVLFR
jgi:hypothetical protein